MKEKRATGPIKRGIHMKHMHTIMAAVMAIALNTLYAPAASACTGISLKTAKGEYLHARTIEWAGYNLNSKLVVIPRGYADQSFTPQGKTGMKWNAKYGLVGTSTVMDEFIADGINEKGLAAGIFYFRNYGSLEKFIPSQAKRSVSDADLVRWLLGSFATVDEALKGLKKIRVIAVDPGKGGEPGATGHWRIADATGRSIVLEITDNGQRHVYENKAGVLTNSPDFPWHLTNLTNYINLEPGGVAPRNINGLKLTPFGGGTAALGLPGDLTPPSRFVRAFFWLHSSPVPADAETAMKQAFHILNNFDIPLGAEFAPGEKLPDMPSATQWTAVSDMTNKIFYYRTMYDASIRQINMQDIDFGKTHYTVRPLDETLQQPTRVLTF